MTNTTNTNFKELLNIAPHVGKVSHTIYNVDFLKPFMCEKIEGNFTIKKVNDIVKNAGFNNAQIIVYMTDAKGYRRNRLYLVKITETDFYIETPIKLWKAGETDNIDTYWRKADFNETRKSSTAIAYIIAQNKNDLTAPKAETVDRSARFKYLKHETHTSKAGVKYITRVYVSRTDDTGSRYTINDHSNYVYTNQLEKYTKLSEIIDKSGYITKDKRENLKRAAQKIKADREKAKYMQTDYTGQIEALEKEIKEKRDILADKLKKATTYEDFKTIAEKITSYKGLKGCFFDLDLLKERYNNNYYSSNDHILKAITNIHEEVAAI